ncbi:MAG: PLP-dependent aminotransferase family protein [Lachnospiraceae bacterium]
MWIAIDRQSQLTLARQIYRQIRQMILNGTLSSGYKLPSTRTLSSELSVSRNTVIEAYSQLIAEGYLTTYKGSGTVVADGLQALDIALTFNQRAVPKPDKISPAKEMIDFRTGVPALEYFPRKEWSNLYREICSTIPNASFGYCKTSGALELREAIAQYLYRVRGMSCDPAQIMITSGSTQGLSLISHVLSAKQNVVLVENPTHAGLRKVISSTGCSLEGIPVDDKGMCTELLREKQGVSFIYTTPSHQYPLGGVLPIQRRLELVRYAEQNDCYIVEDDYDSEFRYEGQPVSTLYELKPQHVIYLGSFSKILAPALRLGFMILPEKLLSPCKRQKLYSDVHTDVLGQYTLAQFIREGSFEKHVWKMKKHYRRNRNLLLAELSKHFPNQFNILGQATGLHVVVRFHDMLFTKETVMAIEAGGVRVYRTGSFYLEKNQEHDNEIIMGYSHLSPEKIAEGIKIIGGVAHSCEGSAT